MSKLRNKKIYTIIDIETTGGMSKRDRITEIGIVKHDGEKIIETFSSLVNPERSIPNEITRITGITNQMVANAPKFYELAKKIIEITENAIFVAHNVSFDYGFIKEEFASLGYTFTRKQLCTVKLTRKVFPGLRSYSLGNLIVHFGIEVNARHRALDDAMATVIVLEKIFKKSVDSEEVETMINKGIKETRLPESLNLEKLHALPEEAGIYFMYNTYGKVIYIGKSINIKSRMMQHFSGVTRKTERMIQQVADIDFEITGHELSAIITESYAIKSFQPEINKAQRTSHYPIIVYKVIDKEGYINFRVDKSTNKKISPSSILTFTSSVIAAKSRLSNIRQAYQLCEHKIFESKSVGSPCIYTMMNECLRACVGDEDAVAYNVRALLAVEALDRLFSENFFIIIDGRSKNESCIILIEDGFFQGLGYINKDDVYLGIEEMREAIDYQKKNIEVNSLILQYMSTHKDYKIIKI
jgi:DNA polymerase-3 subunit epsilon